MVLNDAYQFASGLITRLFLNPGSIYFVGALFCALLVATVHLVLRRLRKGRVVRARTILAGLFPARIFRHRSMRADILLFFVNTLMTGLLIGWAIVGFGTVSEAAKAALDGWFGTQAPTAWPEWAARGLATLIFFLAYEFGYWADHTLKHKVPMLWEFHKVHHSAEHLTPLTASRMHPVDSWIFANILSVTVGITAGTYAWAMGGTVSAYTLTGTNLILVIFIHLYLHLQHSEFWIPFTGWRGKVFMSPAHHQIHHSSSVRHFDKNMGSCLSVWDWLFGTLYMPAKEREKFGFGIDANGRDPHEMGEALFGPFRDAAGHVLPQGLRSKPEAPPQTST
jgi:sterol desaturase/sphingolipid hydroxylase (fatty acid hydroxylase superfamily)